MVAYVDRGALKVGDQVTLLLCKGLDPITVIQVSTVISVKSSEHHGSDPMDEINF